MIHRMLSGIFVCTISRGGVKYMDICQFGGKRHIPHDESLPEADAYYIFLSTVRRSSIRSVVKSVPVLVTNYIGLSILPFWN